MKSSIFFFYLTEIPRLRRVEDWPHLVEILERSQTNQRNQNHKNHKADRNQSNLYIHIHIRIVYMYVEVWGGERYFGGLNWATERWENEVEELLAELRIRVAKESDPRDAVGASDSKQLVYIALSNSISLSFSLSIVITKPPFSLSLSLPPLSRSLAL
jgi:hypothetical protein